MQQSVDKARSSAQRRGTLYVFLAAVLYSIGGLCIKVIPWNGMAINGGRNMVDRKSVV